MINEFITERYADIMLMSKKICRSNPQWEEVGHYCLEKFMLHERAEELISTNRAMRFISGIIHRSFHSSTSQYHTDIREKNRTHGLSSKQYLESDNIDYNYGQDNAVESIQTILEEMISQSNEQWFRSVLFQMWVNNPNYSKLSRETGFPRTSISRSIKEAREYIKQELINKNIDYEL